MTVFSHEGEEKARQTFQAAWDVQQALRSTVEYYNRMAGVAQVMTPDPQINLGVTWARVNMLRVMANYPTGPAFTNDPSRSSAVVGRDACWFSTGCDFLLPAFSRKLLESLAARQRENGLILEYYNAVTDERADNGFNINDNTPLFIWAVWHHYLSTRDEAFLQQIYPAVWNGQCILRARDTALDEVPPGAQTRVDYLHGARRRGLWHRWLAQHHPQLHYAHDPKKNLTVPGEFSEWMDGESLVNRGMRLSPWEPPRFVLAAIHGICGLQPELDGITFKPSIPKHWKWAGLRRFPHRGHELAFFGAVQQDGNHLYGIIGDVSSSQAQKHAHDEDVTAHVYSRNMQAQHLAFRRPGEQAA